MTQNDANDPPKSGATASRGPSRRTVHVVRPDAAPFDAAPLGAAPLPDADDADLAALMRAMLHELRLGRTQAEAANRRLTDTLRREMQWNRRLLRVLAQRQVQPLEDEIAACYGAVQLGFSETLDTVYAERLSLARFGDGELQLMLDPEHQLQFQRNSPRLQADLAEVLTLQTGARDRVLVALPHLFRADVHWMTVWSLIWHQLKPMLDPAGRYGNAHVSRPIYFREQGAAGIARWRRLWTARKVLIVTGRESRFDPIPALFDCAARIETILTATQNAHDHLDALLVQVQDRAEADTLVLLSLGPAATVLVPRIAAQGIQALDVGHISASYLNVHAGGALPESMPTTRNPGL